MIKTLKEEDGSWTVYDDETMIAASIIKIKEYSIIPEDEKQKKYRVDFKSKTIKSFITDFDMAVSIAAKAIKAKKEK